MTLSQITMALGLLSSGIGAGAAVMAATFSQRITTQLTEVEAIRAQLEAEREALRIALADWTRRILAGEIVVVSEDDGTVGQLVVEPVGEFGLRVRIQPIEVTH